MEPKKWKSLLSDWRLMCPLPGERVHPAPVQALRQLAFYIDDKEKKMSKKLLFNLLAVLALATILWSIWLVPGVMLPYATTMTKIGHSVF